MATHKNMLDNRVIAVPESRQENVMAQLLENRGAEVLRVPMISIHDAPDSEQVLLWIRQFIARPPDLLIIYTGEGVRRLLALAEQFSIKESFISHLAQVTKLCRGPKPIRVLRDLGLSCEIPAFGPTTEGVITSLESLRLNEQRVAVQLYGEEPNHRLMNYLVSKNVEIEKVAPYVYADKAEEAKLVDLINAMGQNEVDAIAFTSQAQFKRLHQVAKAKNMEQALFTSLAKVRVAVVGPLVKEQLEAVGVQVNIMPEKAFFMKPLVTAIMKDFNQEG